MTITIEENIMQSIIKTFLTVGIVYGGADKRIPSATSFSLTSSRNWWGCIWDEFGVEEEDVKTDDEIALIMFEFLTPSPLLSLKLLQVPR